MISLRDSSAAKPRSSLLTPGRAKWRHNVALARAPRPESVWIDPSKGVDFFRGEGACHTKRLRDPGCEAHAHEHVVHRDARINLVEIRLREGAVEFEHGMGRDDGGRAAGGKARPLAKPRTISVSGTRPEPNALHEAAFFVSEQDHRPPGERGDVRGSAASG